MQIEYGYIEIRSAEKIALFALKCVLHYYTNAKNINNSTRIVCRQIQKPNWKIIQCWGKKRLNKTMVMMMMMPILVGVSSKDSFFLSLCFSASLRACNVSNTLYSRQMLKKVKIGSRTYCFETIVDATVVLYMHVFLLFLSTISCALYFCMCFLCLFSLLKPKTFTK